MENAYIFLSSLALLASQELPYIAALASSTMFLSRRASAILRQSLGIVPIVAATFVLLLLLRYPRTSGYLISLMFLQFHFSLVSLINGPRGLFRRFFATWLVSAYLAHRTKHLNIFEVFDEAVKFFIVHVVSFVHQAVSFLLSDSSLVTDAANGVNMPLEGEAHFPLSPSHQGGDTMTVVANIDSVVAEGIEKTEEQADNDDGSCRSTDGHGTEHKLSSKSEGGHGVANAGIIAQRGTNTKSPSTAMAKNTMTRLEGTNGGSAGTGGLADVRPDFVAARTSNNTVTSGCTQDASQLLPSRHELQKELERKSSFVPETSTPFVVALSPNLATNPSNQDCGLKMHPSEATVVAQSQVPSAASLLCSVMNENDKGTKRKHTFPDDPDSLKLKKHRADA